MSARLSALVSSVAIVAAVSFNSGQVNSVRESHGRDDVGVEALPVLSDVAFQQDFRSAYGLETSQSYIESLAQRARDHGFIDAYDPALVTDVADKTLVLTPSNLLMTAGDYESVFAQMAEGSLLNGVMSEMLGADNFSGVVLDEANQTLTVRTTDAKVPEALQSVRFETLDVEILPGSMSLKDMRRLQEYLADQRGQGETSSRPMIALGYNPESDAIDVDVEIEARDSFEPASVLARAAVELNISPLPEIHVEYMERPVVAVGGPAPRVANNSIDPRIYGGAAVYGPNGNMCTQSFHVQYGTAVMGTTNAHCSFGDAGVWHGGVGGDFGGTGPWNPNEVWSTQSWSAYYNQLCTAPHQTWIPTGKTSGWAWSDVALLDYWGTSQATGRVYDPTHGYIRVRETIIPKKGEWVMTYGANSNPSTQRIVYVSDVHRSYGIDMKKPGTYYSGGDQCLRAEIMDTFFTDPWGSSPQIIPGDSGGPVTKTVWRNVGGSVVAVALPAGIISNLVTGGANVGAAWHSYMWNVNNALGVAPLQGS